MYLFTESEYSELKRLVAGLDVKDANGRPSTWDAVEAFIDRHGYLKARYLCDLIWREPARNRS